MQTTTVNITGGSEKQNIWASEIAAAWIKELSAEIELTAIRPDLSAYLAILEQKRNGMIAGFAKVTAKQVIDLYTAKRNAAKAMIEQARKEYRAEAAR